MPDDAHGRRHGVDNRRSHHRGVKRNHRGRCRRQLVIIAPSPPPTMLATAARPRDHHREDTTAPEFTFVPADYTVECSTDAHGRRHGVRQPRSSHHRGSSETTASDAAGNHGRSHLTATDDAATAARPQTITVEDTSAVFTVPADYTVECSDDAHGRRYGVRHRRSHHRGVKRNHRGRCRRQLRDRSHLHRHRRCWQCGRSADHHREDTTAPEFTFVRRLHHRML